MAKETKKLVAAFAMKEEIDGFLTNLEQLKADGTVTEEQYAATKEEYDQKLGTATSEIAQIKSGLEQQLEARQRDIETYKWELGKLEVKYKAGKLPMGKYQSSDQKLRARIEALEAECEELKRLIAANSITDVGVPAKKLPIATSQLPSLTKLATSAKQVKLPPVKLPELSSLAKVAVPVKKLKMPRVSLLALVAGVLLLISVFLPWIAASETLGAQLGSVPGRDVSDIIGRVGLFGGLIIMGTAFLPLPKLRGVLQTLIGIGALAALGYVVVTGALPLLNEYARTLMVIREGLYLYGIVALMLIITGSIERRRLI